MNPIKAPEIKIELDRERTMKFSWAAIDYLTDKYESVGEALALIGQFTNPMTMTKDTKNAIMDFFVALLLADDPKMNIKTLKSILPMEKLIEIAPKITQAIKEDSVQNPL